MQTWDIVEALVKELSECEMIEVMRGLFDKAPDEITEEIIKNSSVDMFTIIFPDKANTPQEIDELNDTADRTLDYMFSNNLITNKTINTALDHIMAKKLISDSDLCEQVIEQCPHLMLSLLLEDIERDPGSYNDILVSDDVRNLFDSIINRGKEEIKEEAGKQNKVDLLRKALRG